MHTEGANPQLVYRDRMGRRIFRSENCCTDMVFIGKGNVRFQGIHICMKCHRIWKLTHKQWTLIADNLNELFKDVMVNKLRYIAETFSREI